MGKRGFTLIEVMIVAAIGAVITLGLAQAILHQVKNTQYLYDKIQYLNTTGTIETYLKTAASCQTTLSPLTIPAQLVPGATPGSNQIRFVQSIRDRNNRVVFRSNSQVTNSAGATSLSIGRMYFVNLSVAGPDSSGEIEVRVPIQRIRTGGGPQGFAEYSFRTTVTVNSASQITGCFDPSSLQAILQTARHFEVTACHRHGYHVITSQCPANWALLSCTGGPGDQHESMEGWYILPNFTNNTCELRINEPACVAGAQVTYQRSIAICYQVGP